MTPWQLELYGMDFADELMKRELDENINPIHVREFQGRIYILDGHHRVGAAIVYDKQLDAKLITNYDTCKRERGIVRKILQDKYLSIEKNDGLSKAPTLAVMISLVYEDTMHTFADTSDYKRSHIIAARQRAGVHLTEWVNHNL